MPQLFYTKEEVDSQLGQIAALGNGFDQVMSFFRREHLRDAKRKEEYYPFIPFGSREAVTQIIEACEVFRNYHSQDHYYSPSFLDVGCGIGNILVLAKGCGTSSTTGIEYNTTYSKVGLLKSMEMPKTEIFKPKNWTSGQMTTEKLVARYNETCCYASRVLEGDAFNFKGYNAYDIVYYFCPINKTKLEVKLERLIEDSMLVGSVLIANHKTDYRIRKDARFKNYYDLPSHELGENYKFLLERIWLKVADGEAPAADVQILRYEE